ncbi:MAG: FKBP-type peptidyl-prolyl cis-trans isomerase [Gemmatimonadota bacterium]
MRALSRTAAVYALSLVLLTMGCSLDTFRKKTPSSGSGEPETLTYASELGVDLSKMTRTSSGLYYLDKQVGTGATAAAGNVVLVGYKGWLANGRLFDQSGEGDPIRFVLGSGRVIQGWDEGIEGMRVGGKRLLVIAPSLGYGAQSPGAGIPPNATLVFDVTLEGAGQ